MRARDIADAFERIAPIHTGIAGDQLGFIFGDPEREVGGVACLWNVHAQSLTTCVERNLQMLICHEGIWLPEQDSPWYDGPQGDEIHGNAQRRQLLEGHSLVVYRSHSNWDALRDDGVADQAVASLGIDGLREVARQRFFSVCELPEAVAVTDLEERVAAGLGFDRTRIFGDRHRQIRRFAFLIGGFGENQHHMPQAARDMGAEAIVIGEMSEFIVIACLEMGLPVIESLHSASEIPAIRRQADLLSARLPGARVEYIASGSSAFETAD